MKKVPRGLASRVDSDLSAGGPSYGYCPVAGAPGQLEIEPAEAEVVRRIFREYAAGASPREIAQKLNADGVLPLRDDIPTVSRNRLEAGFCCSRECDMAHRATLEFDKACQCCGQAFVAKSKKAMFCSSACSQVVSGFRYGRPPKTIRPHVFDYVFRMAA